MRKVLPTFLAKIAVAVIGLTASASVSVAQTGDSLIKSTAGVCTTALETMDDYQAAFETVAWSRVDSEDVPNEALIALALIDTISVLVQPLEDDEKREVFASRLAHIDEQLEKRFDHVAYFTPTTGDTKQILRFSFEPSSGRRLCVANGLRATESEWIAEMTASRDFRPDHQTDDRLITGGMITSPTLFGATDHIKVRNANLAFLNIDRVNSLLGVELKNNLVLSTGMVPK